MVIAGRWWYHAPWKVTRPWLPSVRVYPHGDERCNDTLWLQLPFAGAVVIRFRPGPLRTEACAELQAEFGPWCEGCEHCHTGQRCHPGLAYCKHTYKQFVEGLAPIVECPKCGGDYCAACEAEPNTDTCPMGALALMPVTIGRNGEREPMNLKMAEGELIYCGKCKTFYRPGSKCSC